MRNLFLLFLVSLTTSCQSTTNEPEETTIPVTVWTECDQILDPLPMLFVDDRPAFREQTSQNQAVIWLVSGNHYFEAMDIRALIIPQRTSIQDIIGVELPCGIDMSGSYAMYDLACLDPERTLVQDNIQVTVYDNGINVLLDVIGPDSHEVGYLLKADRATLGNIELELDYLTGEIIRHGESRSDSGTYCPIEQQL